MIEIGSISIDIISNEDEEVDDTFTGSGGRIECYERIDIFEGGVRWRSL